MLIFFVLKSHRENTQEHFTPKIENNLMPYKSMFLQQFYLFFNGLHTIFIQSNNTDTYFITCLCGCIYTSIDNFIDELFFAFISDLMSDVI